MEGECALDVKCGLKWKREGRGGYDKKEITYIRFRLLIYQQTATSLIEHAV
jgi:hypothetical protein